MRLGRTTAVHFAAQLGSSLFGFIATVYFARELGSSVLGVYFLTLSLVGWLRIRNNMGVSLALTKRVSEKENKNQYVIASLSLITAAFIVISGGIYATRDYVNQYLGDELYIYVIILLGADILYLFVSAIIKGEQLVHIQGIASFCETVLRVIFQTSAVIFGLGAVGLVLGQAAATAVLAVLAAITMLTYFGRSINMKKPGKEYYRSLLEYAKFSWLGSIKGGIYHRMDIIVLGLFVPSNLIGVYSICWNIASILEIFGKSLSTIVDVRSNYSHLE